MTKLTPRARSSLFFCVGVAQERGAPGTAVAEADFRRKMSTPTFSTMIVLEQWRILRTKTHIVCPARNTHTLNIRLNIRLSISDRYSSRVCTFVPIPPAMVLHRMSWADEIALFYEWETQIGADNSLVFDDELVFVIRPDELFGQIERVDFPWHSGVIEDDRDFSSADVISTRRGLVVTAVTAVQRAFRRRRYVQWYGESGAWNNFVTDVVAWINSKCRYFPNREHDVFGESMMPTWGYVPTPVPDRPLLVPALGRPPWRSVIVLD